MSLKDLTPNQQLSIIDRLATESRNIKWQALASAGLSCVVTDLLNASFLKGLIVSTFVTLFLLVCWWRDAAYLSLERQARNRDNDTEGLPFSWSLVTFYPPLLVLTIVLLCQ